MTSHKEGGGMGFCETNKRTTEGGKGSKNLCDIIQEWSLCLGGLPKL